MITSQKIEYQDGDTLLEGFIAYNEEVNNEAPVILVCHDWSGCNDFAHNKAKQIAELGYIGFAVDMYGKGKIARTKEEKTTLMQPLIQNRTELLSRISAAFETAKKTKGADRKIGAIGFCFGGLCALDLARHGADIKGVVSFHGALHPPGIKNTRPITSKILVLHGYADPMVPSDHVITFANEMAKAKADWQIDMYGNAMHSFTNPEANDAGSGIAYNKQADIRSWKAMQYFLKETFGM